MRYQNCNLFVKMWRRRYYLLIPYYALHLWYYTNKYLNKIDDPLSFDTCWHIAIGQAQANMNWLYDWKDVKKRLESKWKN